MAKRKQVGHLPPEYNFSLNPYPQFRFSKCPDCQNKTGQRKLPLIVHIDPGHLTVLNYTNRYCRHCDMLIGHKHEMEHHLTQTFLKANPDIIGNNYLVFGTVEKKAWRENQHQQIRFDDVLNHTHDFLNYRVIRMSMGGWFAEGQVPPIMEPPPSTEWLKQ